MRSSTSAQDRFVVSLMVLLRAPDGLAQPRQRSRHALARRRFVDAAYGRDLAVRELARVAKDQRLALARPDAPEGGAGSLRALSRGDQLLGRRLAIRVVDQPQAIALADTAL